MASVLQMLGLIPKAVRAFFKADIKLRRDGAAVKLAFEEAQAAPQERKKKPKKVDPKAEKAARELAEIRASLAVLMDEMPSNRQALRQLAFIEHALDRKGLRALHKVPVDVLQRALAQLESLVTNWSDPGLAALRSHMAVTLIEREPERTRSLAVQGAASQIDSTAPLAMPEDLDGDAAAEAEAALRAAYGEVDLPGLTLDVKDAPAPEVQVQDSLGARGGKGGSRAHDGQRHSLPA